MADSEVDLSVFPEPPATDETGLYSYMYAVVKDGEYTPDLVTFEGTHFQTENEYAILVYHRPLGLDFDRLLTYKIIKVNSVN